MTRYWVHPRDKIFAKGYGFFIFAKNKGKNIGKNIIKNLSNKYIQELLDHAKNLQAMHLTLQRFFSHWKNSRVNWWFDW